MAFRAGIVPVAISEEVRNGIASMYGIAKCPFIPNGIPVEHFAQGQQNRELLRKQEGIGPDDIAYICVGRMTPQKEHALLLRAFAQDLSRDPRAKLLLAGDGELRRSLEAQSESAGVKEKVRFLGVRNDIPELLGAADVFVLSSKYEGHPLCVMEAMAAGLPVIATAVGGLPELVEEGRSGILVPPADAAALGNAMTELLESPDLLRGMGNAASERAKARFDIKVMTEAYGKLYEELCDR